MSRGIAISRLAKSFADGGGVLAIEALSIAAGEIVALVGPSGCGKSTLLRLIAGLDRDYSGTVQVGEQQPPRLDRQVGFIFQEPRLFPWLDVADNVAFGLAPARQGQRAQIVARLLEQVQLSEAAHRHPRDLSGGMMQRVAIARALAAEPHVLLLDEPFSAVDAFTRMHLQDLILALLGATGPTMLVVTHDIDEALYLADRVVVLSERPARVQEVLGVGLARPRDRRDPRLGALRVHLLEQLRLVGARSAARDAAVDYVI